MQAVALDRDGVRCLWAVICGVEAGVELALCQFLGLQLRCLELGVASRARLTSIGQELHPKLLGIRWCGCVALRLGGILVAPLIVPP